MNNDKWKKEYPNLLTFSIILKIIGVLAVVYALIALFYGLSILDKYEKEGEGLYFIISSIISGIFLGIPFLAFPELIKLFIRIEINTRENTIQEAKKLYDIKPLQENISNSKIEISFKDWKKKNPTKSLNEYYESMTKK